MFAFGHIVHQPPILSTLTVASLRLFLVRGCFPGDEQSGRRQSQAPSIGVCSGSTPHPAAANARALSRRAFMCRATVVLVNVPAALSARQVGSWVMAGPGRAGPAPPHTALRGHH